MEEVDLDTLEIIVKLLVAELAKPFDETQRSVDRLAKVIRQLPMVDQYQKGIVSGQILTYGEKEPAGIVSDFLMNLLLEKYA